MLTFNLKKYELNKNGIMLDVGCGEGRHIFGIMQDYPQMKCIGLDMDNASLQKAEEVMNTLSLFQTLVWNSLKVLHILCLFQIKV